MTQPNTTSTQSPRTETEAPKQARSAEEVREWLFNYLRAKEVKIDTLDLKEDATSLGLDSLEMERLIGDFEVWAGAEIDVASVVRCENLGDLLAYFETVPGSGKKVYSAYAAQEAAAAASTKGSDGTPTA